MTSASVQAAVYVRERQKLRQNKQNNIKKGRFDLPSHVATKDIAPFPTFPPTTWGKAGAAWLERERKSGISPSGEIPLHLAAHRHRLKSTSEGHKRGSKRNKVHDSPIGESNLDVRGGLHKQYDAAANMLLYVGLCAVSLGLVISFVGTGEKGFKTVELRLIGPSVIGFGLFCCTLRILLCFCPTRYMRRRFKHRHKKHAVDIGLSDGAELNRHGFHNERALEYYKHLPFRPMDSNILLFERSSMMKDSKKRVSITAPREGRRAPPYDPNVHDDVGSDNLSTLRELSPLHEEDLIDFQQCSNSFENLTSLDSSLEYLNEPFDNEIECKRFDNPFNNLISEEHLSRLKSTLTFGDSKDHLSEMLMSSYDDFEQDDADNNCKKEVLRQTKSVGFSEVEEKALSDNGSNQELVLSVGSFQQKS